MPLPARPIQAVDRALDLLEAIAAAADAPPTSELARRAGVNRSTAWRLLATLEAHRLVDRDPASGGYRIAYGAVRLAAAAQPAAIARPLLLLLLSFFFFFFLSLLFCSVSWNAVSEVTVCWSSLRFCTLVFFFFFFFFGGGGVE